MSLVSVNVPSSNLAKAQRFYEFLFGAAPSPNPHSMSEGVMYYPGTKTVFTISRRNDPKEQVVCYFEVRDLDAATKGLEQRGGKVVSKFSMPVKDKDAWGAVVLDPDGNGVGVYSAMK